MHVTIKQLSDEMKNQLKTFAKHKLSISYLGLSDDKITDQLIGLSELVIQSNPALEKLSRKTSILIAESFQNIIRHGTRSGTEGDPTKENDFFQISFLDDRIMIVSKNQIENVNIQNLNDKIDHINELSLEEIKDLWGKLIQQDEFSTKGGAGLGIIEMARKSSLPLKKRFIEMEGSFSQFFLGIEITNKKNNLVSKLDISEIVDQYNEFVNDGLLLMYWGNFSGETNSFLIELLHNNFIDEDNIDSRIIENVTIMIEVIQNVSKHGAMLEDWKPGGFSIFEKESTLHISCHNYVGPGEYITFKNLLESIKLNNLEELKKERNRKMLEDKVSPEGNSGLGFIEIALFTDNEFEYSFAKTKNDLYFFSIELKLKNLG